MSLHSRRTFKSPSSFCDIDYSEKNSEFGGFGIKKGYDYSKFIKT